MAEFVQIVKGGYYVHRTWEGRESIEHGPYLLYVTDTSGSKQRGDQKVSYRVVGTLPPPPEGANKKKRPPKSPIGRPAFAKMIVRAATEDEIRSVGGTVDERTV